MLTELHIENIAVIERADIEPGPGLNVPELGERLH